MEDYIKSLVQSLLKKYNSRNPFEVAAALGINVWTRPLGTLKGLYIIICRERYILINENLCPQEKRIVCAHELGHDRLHQPFAKYSALQDFMLYDMTLKPEHEANIFAAEFLLSDEDVLNLKTYPVEYIAQALETNPDYVRIKFELIREEVV